MRKRKFFNALLFLSVFLACQTVLAEDHLPPEEELLSLYFDEEQLVKTATGSPKPITQVAENVTIVTAEEIEAMHAHSLAEVLSRQSGVFVSYIGQDFHGDSRIELLGSRLHHVLVLIDGVRLNLNSSGEALTNFVPLGIIKRIEIIKGAASSTWGSALGGVINIITKDVGKTERPTGTVKASYGEANSRDISADMAGKVKALGYYLHAGNIDSDGLRFDRYSERNSVYGKMQFDLPYNSRLSATAGYSDPFFKTLNWDNAWEVTDLNIYEDIDHENTWATIFFDTDISKNLSLHLAGQHFDNTFDIDRRSLGTGIGGSQGDHIYGDEWEDEVNSFIARLTWTEESYIANLGFETSRSELDYSSELGTFFGGPSVSQDDTTTEDRHGVYGNITYTKGDFSITPGLRYDYHSNSEETVNPSLGLTYLLTSDTLLRASVAKGFSAPYLSAISHSPDLEPEETWTYQAGIETGRIPFLHVKGTIFYHDIDNAWDFSDYAPWNNAGEIRLTGFELEAKTDSFYGFGLTGNFTYVDEESKDTETNYRMDDKSYVGNLIFSYLNQTYGLRAELAGHYIRYTDRLRYELPEDGSFLWDLLLAKNFTVSSIDGELYLKGYNIFNGDQYWDVYYANPDSWVEIGLVIKF